MKVLITDSELTAYAEGRLSDAEIHALEQKAIKTGQADLLLSVIIAQHSIDMELSREYWGEDPLEYLWEAPASYRAAACKDENFFKKKMTINKNILAQPHSNIRNQKIPPIWKLTTTTFRQQPNRL